MVPEVVGPNTQEIILKWWRALASNVRVAKAVPWVLLLEINVSRQTVDEVVCSGS